MQRTSLHLVFADSFPRHLLRPAWSGEVPRAHCPRPAQQPCANPTASEAAVQLWYLMAGSKLVASLGKTDFGLPENESKITQLLLAAFSCWAQHGADSEGGGAVFGAAQPRLSTSSPQATVYLHQKPGTVITATPTCPLSFVPALCYPKPKSGSCCRFQYISICTFIKGLIEL